MSAKRVPGRHDLLFAEYVDALRSAVDAARKAFDSSNVRPPLVHLGPIPLAVDPRVIAVVRRYFFACDALNRDQAAGSPELPHVFIVERLAGKEDELWKVLTELPYLPIGTDERDQWVDENGVVGDIVKL
jgi:hypothetical protein